jgi:hypothetical protein
MVRACLAAWIAIAACNAQWTQPPFSPDTAKLERADLTEVLGLLCPGQEYVGAESGCRVCPASSKRSGARGDASIVAAVRGHFLKADSDDLLLDLSGCGPALLTRSASGWFVNRAQVLPDGALPDGPCRKLAAGGARDGLVCYEAASSADREEARLTLSLLPEKKIDLAVAFDNTAGACDKPKGVVVQSAIQDVKFTPAAGGKVTIAITTRCRRGPFNDRSRKACASGPGFANIGPAVAFRNFRMDYVLSGDAFSLASASKAIKQAYDLCAASPQ